MIMNKNEKELESTRDNFKRLKGGKIIKVDLGRKYEYEDEEEVSVKLIFDNGMILLLDTAQYYPSVEIGIKTKHDALMEKTE